jgi:hypothetical protein
MDKIITSLALTSSQKAYNLNFSMGLLNICILTEQFLPF